jgi:acyl-CoA thioester hydrolase
MTLKSAHYTVQSPVFIRFSDLDAMGHVNNAVYLSYFEEARIAFFKERIGLNWNWSENGILVVRNEIDYKAPIFHNDAPIAKTWCQSIGRSSLTINYELVLTRSGSEIIASTGSTVIVCYNHKENRTTAVPEEWKQKLSPSAT